MLHLLEVQQNGRSAEQVYSLNDREDEVMEERETLEHLREEIKHYQELIASQKEEIKDLKWRMGQIFKMLGEWE